MASKPGLVADERLGTVGADDKVVGAVAGAVGAHARHGHAGQRHRLGAYGVEQRLEEGAAVDAPPGDASGQVAVVEAHDPTAVHRRGVDSCHVRRLGTQNVADPDPVQDLLPQVLQEDARPHRSGIGHSLDQVHVVAIPVEHEGDRRTSRAASDDGHPQRSHW